MAINRRDIIENQLREALTPTELAIEDESHLHAGHAGAAHGGHFQVRIVSSSLLAYGRLLAINWYIIAFVTL